MNTAEARHWAVILMTFAVACLCLWVGGATWAAAAYVAGGVSQMFDHPGAAPSAPTSFSMVIGLFLAACGW